MKVDQRALAGIEAKVQRADEHFRTLHDEMLAWDTDRPYKLIQEMHDGGRKHLYRLHLLKPIPVEWAVLMGEGLHDLRSALEQCVYWLTVDWSGAALDGTGFPVYTRRKHFEARSKAEVWTTGSGMHKIRGVGPGPQAFIEQLQPYPQRRRSAPVRSVQTVHDLWNQDKHRLVHLWGMRFTLDQATLVDTPSPVDCTPWIDKRVRHENAIVMKIVCATPHPNVKVNGDITAHITVSAGKSAAAAGIHSAWKIVGYVSDVIAKLLGALGHQHEPLNMSVWTARPDYPPR